MSSIIEDDDAVEKLHKIRLSNKSQHRLSFINSNNALLVP